MQVTIRIDEAIAVLTKNYEEHMVELKEATENWTEEVLKELTKFNVALHSKGLGADSDTLVKLVNTRPIDNRKEYDKHIGILDKSTLPTVTIDEEEYDQIFNDNWHWRQLSKFSNSTYRK